MLCADLVEVHWSDKSGRSRRAVGNLEDISASGACLQMENAIPLRSKVRVTHGNTFLEGEVRYCVYREIGYFIGIRFDEAKKWSRSKFEPQHLFDPQGMAAHKRKIA